MSLPLSEAEKNVVKDVVRKKLKFKNTAAPHKHRGGKSLPVRAPITGGIKKPHRFLPGTVAFREIKKQQKSTAFCIRKIPFQRTVREIAQDFMEDCRFQGSAIAALQEAAEDYEINRFKSAFSCALIAGRETVEPQDMKNSERIFKQFRGADAHDDQVIVPPRKPKKHRKAKKA